MLGTGVTGKWGPTNFGPEPWGPLLVYKINGDPGPNVFSDNRDPVPLAKMGKNCVGVAPADINKIDANRHSHSYYILDGPVQIAQLPLL